MKLHIRLKTRGKYRTFPCCFLFLYMDVTTCPHCLSENLIRQTGADEPTKHYGRLKCGDCGKHIQWLKDPSVTLQHMNRTTAINTILSNHSDKLSDWGKEFLVSVREQRVLSLKQQIHLNSIGRQCLGMRICADNSAQKLTPRLVGGVVGDC